MIFGLSQLFQAFAILITIQSSLQIKPGVEAAIKQAFITQVTTKVVPQIASRFEDIDIPNQSKSHCDLTGIKAKISNVKTDTLKVSFNSSANQLGISIDDIALGFSANFHCEQKVVVVPVSVSGDMSADGPFSVSLGLSLNVTQSPTRTGLVPIISIPTFNLDLNPHNFGIHLSCHNCPGFVQELVEDIIKNLVLPKAIDSIKGTIPAQITSTINQNLKSSYPTQFPIGNYGLSIQTSLTSWPVVKSNYLSIPIDGTVFQTSQGYSRKGEPADLPGLSTYLTEGLQLQLSSFVINSAFQILRKDGIQVSVPVGGYNFKVSLSAAQQSTVNFTSGRIEFSGAPDIKIYDSANNQIGSIDTDLALYFYLTTSQPSSSSIATDVKASLGSFSFSSLIIQWNGSTYNLNWFTWLINAAVWVAAKVINLIELNQKFEVPKVEFSALTLNDTDIVLNSGFASIGVDVAFTGSLA